MTTVIPYEKKNGPPSVEDLQILTKILRAMKEDSEKVPSLLTDYILKGEFYNGIGAMAGRFGLVRKYIVLLIH